MAVGTADTTRVDLAAARLLPAGRHGMSRDEVAASQVARLLRAMAEAVAEKGYAATTIADVVGGAGVSRKTFYAFFADKKACFLAAYDACAAVFEQRLMAAPGDGALREQLDAVAASYFAGLAEEPAFARTFIVEVLGAGPAALERRAAIHDRWARLLLALHDAARAQDPALPAVSLDVARAAIGAVNELGSEALRLGATDRLRDLAPLAASIHFALLTHDHGATTA
ncbi:MAG TPA: TetR/AcrR family transcriptional regulator [Baekduia sp.]|nr:TetR/AcrR family transcriptional regulator [Baekduia sp.]